MITGFDEETCPLNAKEFSVLKIIVPKLRKNIGKDMRVGSGAIIRYLKNIYGIDIDEPRLRKIIRFIREQDIIPFLVADNKGYWVENSYKGILKYLQSRIDRRDAHIQGVKDVERWLEKYKDFITKP